MAFAGVTGHSRTDIYGYTMAVSIVMGERRPSDYGPFLIRTRRINVRKSDRWRLRGHNHAGERMFKLHRFRQSSQSSAGGIGRP